MFKDRHSLCRENGHQYASYHHEDRKRNDPRRRRVGKRLADGMLRVAGLPQISLIGPPTMRQPGGSLKLTNSELPHRPVLLLLLHTFPPASPTNSLNAPRSGGGAGALPVPLELQFMPKVAKPLLSVPICPADEQAKPSGSTKVVGLFTGLCALERLAPSVSFSRGAQSSPAPCICRQRAP